MTQLTERSSNGAFDQLVLSERVIDEAQRWYREDPEAFRRLFASLYSIELNGCGTGIGPPTAADLYVGKTLAHTKTMTDAGTLSFGFLSNDFNPLHFNEALAQKTRFKGRIAHGFHTASLFSGVVAELCPWCVYLRQEMEFTAPVRAGDRITATGVVEEIDERGVVTVGLRCTNQRDEVVVRGKAILKKLKEVYD